MDLPGVCCPGFEPCVAYVEAHKVGEEHLAAQRCGGGVRDRGRHVREAAVLAPNQVREGAVLAFCAASRAEEAAGGSEDCTGLLCLLSLLELELLGFLLPLGLLELELEKPLAQPGLVHRLAPKLPLATRRARRMRALRQ